MKWGVVTFPGSNCDQDAFRVVEEGLGETLVRIWHKDADLGGADVVIVPGGFSFGDYLRCGAIARFAPVMEAIRTHAARGGLVMGICNGFQILCEAGLLPGALVRNAGLRFICEDAALRVERRDLPWTRGLPETFVAPIAHAEGRWVAAPPVVERVEGEGQVVFRYARRDGVVAEDANPNGSTHGIAGLVNEGGNVLGMMPHPERNAERGFGDGSGLLLFQSVLASFAGGRT